MTAMTFGTALVHLRAGKEYGEEATCGTKVNYRTEERAIASATTCSAKFNRPLEAYPCYWCLGWHIGRTMSLDEWGRFAATDTEKKEV